MDRLHTFWRSETHETHQNIDGVALDDDLVRRQGRQRGLGQVEALPRVKEAGGEGDGPVGGVGG